MFENFVKIIEVRRANKLDENIFHLEKESNRELHRLIYDMKEQTMVLLKEKEEEKHLMFIISKFRSRRKKATN